MKKNKGSVDGFITTGIMMLMLLIVLLVSVHFVKILTIKRELNQIGRDYLLRLEENGTLTTEEQNALKDELARHNITTYALTYNKDNTRKVFGEQVSIEINMEATPEELGLSKVYSYIKDKIKFRVYYSSMMKGNSIENTEG